MYKFKTNKAYNKFRKRFLLGKDDSGNKLYPWDVVKLSNNGKHFWYTYIWWNHIDGAYVYAYPARIRMGVSRQINFREYLNKTYEENSTIQKSSQKEFQEYYNTLDEDLKQYVFI